MTDCAELSQNIFYITKVFSSQNPSKNIFTFVCPVNNINMSAKKIVWNLCRPNAGPSTLVNVEHLGRKQKMGNLQRP